MPDRPPYAPGDDIARALYHLENDMDAPRQPRPDRSRETKQLMRARLAARRPRHTVADRLSGLFLGGGKPAWAARATTAAVLAAVILGVFLTQRTPAVNAAPASVIGWQPGIAANVPLNGPITVYFSRAMDESSVERAWRLTPPVAGHFVWSDAAVSFYPSREFPSGTYFRLHIGHAARDDQGKPLRHALALAFTTGDALAVTGFTPASGAHGVETNGRISIQFNHPMVALSGLSSQPANPPAWHPHISPHTPGYGYWLGTSTWVFQPNRGLFGSSHYTVTIPAGTQDALGETLGRADSWSFTTVTPAVVNVDPPSGGGIADPFGSIRVTFNQPMATATASAFTLRDSSGASVPGVAHWRSNQLVFKPSAPLVPGAHYTATVSASARAAAGAATLGHDVVWRFTAARLPAVTGVTTSGPAGTVQVRNGSTVDDSYQYANLTLQFSAPMDPCSLAHHVSVSPPAALNPDYLCGGGGVRRPQPNQQDMYDAGGQLDPSSRYTLTVSAGARDAFGRPLAHDFVLHFRTGPLAPSVALYGPAGPTGAISFSAGRAATAPQQEINVATVHHVLLRLDDPGEIVNANTNGQPAGTVIRDWTATIPKLLNRVQNLPVPLVTSGGNPLPAGFYWLSSAATRQPGLPSASMPLSASEFVLATNASITLKMGSNETLAWVTRASDGKPAAGATVRLLNVGGSAFASAATNTDGVAIFPGVTANGPGANSVQAAYVDSEGLIAFAQQYWSPAVPVKSTVGPNGQYVQPPNGLYLYTDRPIYRPGQTVYFKAIARRDDDGAYLPFHGAIDITASSETNGASLINRTLPVDGLGTAHGSFTIPSNTPLGPVDLTLSLRGGGFGPYVTTIQVAAYRKPEFLVSVNPAASTYLAGSRIRASVSTRYLFGAPVMGQQVTWTAYAQPDLTPPPGWDAYSFFDPSALYGPQPANAPGQASGPFGAQIASGAAKTDAAGHMSIVLPATLGSDGLSRTVTIEATATDINHQPVTGRAQLTVRPAKLAIGLRANSFVLATGQPNTINAVTVRPDGSVVADVALEARIYRRTYTDRFVQDGCCGVAVVQVPHDTLIGTQRFHTNAKGLGSFTFTPSGSGSYHIVVTGGITSTSRSPHVATTALTLQAGDLGFADWGTSGSPTISVTADRSIYRVGDTAHLLVAVPFRGPLTALVTVERGHIFSYRVQTFDSNSPTIDVPVGAGYLPNVYVGIAVYRGWNGASAPAWAYGEASLSVSPAPKTLHVSLRQDRSHYHPGDVVTYHVHVSDTAGNGVSAQVSLALVDTAVLALVSGGGQSIVDAFYGQQPLNVTTASDGAISVDHLDIAPGFRFPQGGAGGGGRTAGGYVKSAGDLQRLAPTPRTRRHFLDTAYWRANVTTDAAGNATVRVPLPDNLTTWQLDARAVASNTRVGQATLDTLSTQDVLLRPVLPRFLLQGDTLTVGVIVNNNLRQVVPATVSAHGTGILLTGGSRQITIPAGAERLVTWRARVPQSQRAAITFTVTPTNAGIQGDAVRQTLPVHPPLTDETVATGGQVFGGVRQLIVLPSAASTQLGGLTVQVSAALAAGMGRALTAPGFAALHPFNKVGNDDVASWLQGAVALQRAPAAVAHLTATQRASLAPGIRKAIARLQSDQLGDGGWPWFNGTMAQSDPLITTDAVQALVEVEAAGAQVPNRVIASAQRYLAQHLPPTSVDLDSRIGTLLALASSGYDVSAKAEAIYGDPMVRHNLSASSVAELALILARYHHAGQVSALMTRLDSTAEISDTGAHWENGLASGFGASDVMSTALALHALVILHPHDPFAPAAARWLMAARNGDEWDTPSDTAAALTALAAYAGAAHEGTADYQYRVLLDGTTHLQGSYSPRNLTRVAAVNIPATQLTPGAQETLDIARVPARGNLGPGPLYYLARLQYFLPAARIAARSHGFSVSRRYVDLNGHPLTRAAAGTTLRVEITVTTPQSLHYLQIADPFPAGLEPIDQTLATSRQGLPTSTPGAANAGDLAAYLDNVSLYDDHAQLSIAYLPVGTYTYSYLAQAVTPGTYGAAPTHAQETFFPEVFARSAGSSFNVTGA